MRNERHHNLLHIHRPRGHWSSTRLDVLDRAIVRARSLLLRWCRPIKPDHMGEV